MIQFQLPNMWRVAAGLLGMLAVALGAVAAHALKDPQAALAVERAANYQLIHAVVLLVTTFMPGRSGAVARWLFLLGILLFSVSIYAKYLLHIVMAGKLAPTGGVLLMAGWLSLCFGLRNIQK